MNDKILGDILIELKMVSEKQLAEAFATQKSSPARGTLGQILMNLGYLKEHSLKKALEQYQRRQRFIDVLLNYNFVNQDELDLAIEMSSNEQISLHKVLLNLDFLNFEALAKTISIYSGLPFIHLSRKLPDIKTGLAKSVIKILVTGNLYRLHLTARKSPLPYPDRSKLMNFSGSKIISN